MRQRKLLLPPFHGERMQRYGELMREVAEREIATLAARRAVRGCARACRRVTLEVILRAVFGVETATRLERCARRSREFARLDDRARADRAASRSSARDRRSSAAAASSARIAPVDAARLRGDPPSAAPRPDLEERDDILSLLLQARHEDGTPMSDEELRDELMTLLVAGHETTATVAGLGDRAARAPPRGAGRASRRRRRRAARVRSTPSSRRRCACARCCRSSRGSSRADARSAASCCPRASIVAPCIYLVHRRPDVYPEPARASGPSASSSGPPAPTRWIPFGGGVRRCLGASFALFEMRIVLQAIARQRAAARRRSPRRARRAGGRSRSRPRARRARSSPR